jgi:putative sigma-54 modulation protein
MQLSHTFRNIDSSDALKEYSREKLERINKHFPDPIKAHVVFSQQRGYLSVVDVQITLHNGLVLKGVESTEDFHSSIDLVMAKIERQLRRYKDRIRDHKPHLGPERAMLHRVVHYEPTNESPKAAPAAPVAPVATHALGAAPIAVPTSSATGVGSRVIKEEKFIAKPMSVEEAIMRMNLLHENIVCFHNIATHEINVIYRREDHTYGLIETTHEPAPEPVRDQATDKISGLPSGAHGHG